MPRGTRAIHGAEVDADHHGSSGNTTKFVSPACRWLPVTCWCEAFIVVATQEDLRWQGRTMSCGMPDCEAPDGTREIGLILDHMHGGASGSNIFGTFYGQYLDDDAILDWLSTPRSQSAQAKAARKVMAALGKKQESPGRPAAPTPKVRRTVRRLKSWEVALRRDTVEQLWRQGLRNPEIAAHFDGGDTAQSRQTVANDLHWLRNQGRIPDVLRRHTTRP